MRRIISYSLAYVFLLLTGCGKVSLDSVPFPSGEDFQYEPATEAQWNDLGLIGSTWQLDAFYEKGKISKWQERKDVRITYSFLSSDKVKVMVSYFSTNPHKDGPNVLSEVREWSYDSTKALLTIGKESSTMLDAQKDSFYLLRDLSQNDFICIGQYELAKFVRAPEE